MYITANHPRHRWHVLIGEGTTLCRTTIFKNRRRGVIYADQVDAAHVCPYCQAIEEHRAALVGKCEVCDSAPAGPEWRLRQRLAVCWPCFWLLWEIERSGYSYKGAPAGYMALHAAWATVGRTRAESLRVCRVYGRAFVPVAEVHRVMEERDAT